MELSEAIRERRSCRSFSPAPVEEEKLQAILESAVWAPSPANRQPWEFVVVREASVKEELYHASTALAAKMQEVSGWGWLGKYRVDFLRQAPLLVVVLGDPAGTGVDMFMEGRREAYKMACAAAVQNMLLKATELGLGSLWFTLFEKDFLRRLLQVGPERDPLSIVCLGYPAEVAQAPPRRPLAEKVTYRGQA